MPTARSIHQTNFTAVGFKERAMNRFRKFCGLILLTSVFTLPVVAQTDGLPRLRKGENYAKVRSKLLKAGWKPFHSPDAAECLDGDARCAGRPEMENCAGTGLAPCLFLWKRKGRTAVIYTIGEEANYNGYEFQK